MFPGDVCSNHAARLEMVVVCSTMPPHVYFVKDQRGVRMEMLVLQHEQETPSQIML
jgi:hypothetical protein